MRHFIFTLLTLLVAMPTFAADEIEQTEVPVIAWTCNETQVEVRAVGYGNVHLYCEGIEVDNPYYVDRGMEDQELTFSAYALEDGKLSSDYAYAIVTVPALPVTPEPIIVYEVIESEVVVTVEGEGEIYVTCDGTPVDNPFTIQRTDQTFVVTIEAQAFMSGYQPSMTTIMYIEVPAMVTSAPTLTANVEEYGVLFSADGDGMVYLFVDGEEVENPCFIPRGNEPREVTVTAYAQEEGKQRSETVIMGFVIPVLDKEMVSEPIITLERNARTGTYTVYMSPTEPLTYCFYDLFFKENEEDNWEQVCYSNEYFGPMEITTLGYWMVGSYAVTPDDSKDPSPEVYAEFRVTAPEHDYDFVVDGIFYKITSERKVSVTYTGFDDDLYQGDIVIPSQVTHEGVTYNVTAIGDEAFENCIDMTSVTIGAYVTAIGDRAFRNCTGLTNVTLGNYVTTIGEDAFSSCSNLATVTLGSGVRTIGSRAFANCLALTTVISKPATPPTMSGKDCFDCYGTATLHVHPAVADSYAALFYWNHFVHVVAEDKVEPRMGDANGDGVLSVGDVTAIIRMILTGN